MNKKNILSITLMVISIVSNLSWIWLFVEFLIYLFKDHQFNWCSLWITIVLFIITFSLKVYEKILDKKLIEETTKESFKERLNRMAKERGYEI